MAKPAYCFEDFLAEVGGDYREAVQNVHETLLRDGYKVKIESKASGFFVSYAHPQTRRSLLNFLFRKAGLVFRIYADNCGHYAAFLNSLPEEMKKQLEKAPPCKRLIDPLDCNPKCVTGYDFHVGENHYQKCRYSCFQFAVTPENLPVLLDFIDKERRKR